MFSSSEDSLFDDSDKDSLYVPSEEEVNYITAYIF